MAADDGVFQFSDIGHFLGDLGTGALNIGGQALDALQVGATSLATMIPSAAIAAPGALAAGVGHLADAVIPGDQSLLSDAGDALLDVSFDLADNLVIGPAFGVSDTLGSILGRGDGAQMGVTVNEGQATTAFHTPESNRTGVTIGTGGRPLASFEVPEALRGRSGLGNRFASLFSRDDATITEDIVDAPEPVQDAISAPVESPTIQAGRRLADSTDLSSARDRLAVNPLSGNTAGFRDIDPNGGPTRSAGIKNDNSPMSRIIGNENIANIRDLTGHDLSDERHAGFAEELNALFPGLGTQAETMNDAIDLINQQYPNMDDTVKQVLVNRIIANSSNESDDPVNWWNPTTWSDSTLALAAAIVGPLLGGMQSRELAELQAEQQEAAEERQHTRNLELIQARGAAYGGGGGGAGTPGGSTGRGTGNNAYG